MKRLVHALSLALAVALVQAPGVAHACSVCMGAADGGKIPAATNGAMFLMLGCIGAMLAGISAVGFVIVRRAHTPLPPHVQLAEMIGTPTTR